MTVLRCSVGDKKSFVPLLAEKTARLARGISFCTGHALECGIRDEPRAAMTRPEHGPGSEALKIGSTMLPQILFVIDA